MNKLILALGVLGVIGYSGPKNFLVLTEEYDPLDSYSEDNSQELKSLKEQMSEIQQEVPGIREDFNQVYSELEGLSNQLETTKQTITQDIQDFNEDFSQNP